jgi:transcriptional regulator with XRE-family HTH domain
MKTEHEILLEDPEFRKMLSVESLVAEASETIARLMAERNVSKADLARRLNKSRSWVTQLLSGSANMTVRTLAEVAYALDAEVTLRAERPAWAKQEKTRGSESERVIYRLDDYLVRPPDPSTSVFRLPPEMMERASDDVAPVKPDDTADSEYAA